ncbi:MAG: hypothetical protein R3282_09765, partial [Rhodothermales bacterium]|nr:hypothetical protein [Rhodothermales bacterium]
MLWPIPLLNTLHVESTAVLAFVAFFVSGLSSVALVRRGVSAGSTLVVHVLLLIVPLALLSVTRLWVPQCDFWTGLMFYCLFPLISTVLGTGLANLLHTLALKRPGLWLTIVGLAVSLVTPLYDIGLHPQLYTYNHVFGGVLGPIYDEELAIRPGLFAFRGMTLLWAGLAFAGAAVLRRRAGLGSTATAITLAISVGIVIGYSRASDLGWNTTHAVIQEKLGSESSSEHFDIFYDKRSFLPGQIERLTSEMEYRYASISERLDEQVGARILVYLYPTAALKGSLTGSRYTSVTPV